MKGEKVNFNKLILSSVGFSSLLIGMYFILSRELYFSIKSLSSSADIVEINVYALWIPIGFFGVLVWCISGLVTVIKFKLQVNLVWEKGTQKKFNQMMGMFAVLGLFFAIGTYQWLTSELDARGYVYSEEQSTLSAMGKHEVYIKP